MENIRYQSLKKYFFHLTDHGRDRNCRKRDDVSPPARHHEHFGALDPHEGPVRKASEGVRGPDREAGNPGSNSTTFKSTSTTPAL
jgi:hypothetical protein